MLKNRLSGLLHYKIHSWWNRPESLLLKEVQDVRLKDILKIIFVKTLLLSDSPCHLKKLQR